MGEIDDDPRQSDMREILEMIQQERGAGVTLRGRIAQCLTHFHAIGLHLSTCADSRHLNRSVGYLEGIARDKGLRFPDYVPYVLRTEDERKRGPRK